MKRIFMIGILFFMVACQPSAEAIQKAIKETQSAAPTATPIPTNTPIPTSTPILLSDIDLSAIAIVAGDLPAGYSPAQIRSDPPKMFSGVKNYENIINQQFENKGDTAAAGGVTIFLFNELSDNFNV